MAVIESMELAQVLSEAGDIARNVNQRLTSAHLLLAFFVVPNRAEMLLRERGVDEDRILLAMPGAPEEPEGLERDLRDRARQVAEGLRADETDCIHLLIAMTRVRQCSAHQLLSACGLELAALRNVALSYYTAGMPRRLRRVPQPATRAPAPAPRRPSAPPRAEPGDLDLEGEPIDDDEPETGAGTLDLSPRPPSRPAFAAPAASPSRSRTAHALDPADFPWLSQLGRNLTELAAAGRLDPLVGREVEVEQTLDVLGKRRTNNPLLVGEAGVGKTAIVEGVAQRLLAQGSPRVLVELDMASVLSGTQLRGSFSEKLRGIQDEVRRAEGRVVVFIDEVHTRHGRRLHRRGAAGRRQRAQGRPGPRRVPLHRRHHPRRVPQAHRAGPGAGAPLHPGAGARAVGPRHRPHPRGHPAPLRAAPRRALRPGGRRGRRGPHLALRSRPVPPRQGGGRHGPGRLPRPPAGRLGRGRRRRGPRGRPDGGHPRVAPPLRRPRPAARPGGRALPADRRPPRDHRPGGARAAAQLRRLRLPPPHGQLPLPRPHRGGQDRAGPGAGRRALRQRPGPGPARHERVQRAHRGGAARGRRPRVRRLRRGGPAHRRRPAPARQRRGPRRDRQGPPRRPPAPPPGPRGGAAHRRARAARWTSPPRWSSSPPTWAASRPPAPRPA